MTQPPRIRGSVSKLFGTYGFVRAPSGESWMFRASEVADRGFGQLREQQVVDFAVIPVDKGGGVIKEQAVRVKPVAVAVRQEDVPQNQHGQAAAESARYRGRSRRTHRVWQPR